MKRGFAILEIFITTNFILNGGNDTGFYMFPELPVEIHHVARLYKKKYFPPVFVSSIGGMVILHVVQSFRSSFYLGRHCSRSILSFIPQRCVVQDL